MSEKPAVRYGARARRNVPGYGGVLFMRTFATPEEVDKHYQKRDYVLVEIREVPSE